MYLAVTDIEASNIDAVELEQGKGRGETARELAMPYLKSILHIQLTLELMTQLIAPIIEIASDHQG
jgi:hypothetical protein